MPKFKSETIDRSTLPRGRQEAFRLGSMYFIALTACNKCGGDIRLSSTSVCLDCRELRRVRESKEQGITEEVLYHKSYYYPKARLTELARGHEIDQLTLEELEEIRGICLAASQHTLNDPNGLKYEVDHRIPLGEGGKHHPYNLQILDQRQHGLKTAEEHYELRVY